MAFAHDGEDHGAAAPAPAPASTGGGIVVPKEGQFALGILTELAAPREMTRSTVVTGRVVPRTEAVADVVAPIGGRVTGGGLPRLGDRVARGEVLFRVAQVLSPSERASLRSEAIRARAELASAEREVSRMERLEGVVAGKQVVEAKIRLDAARDAYAAINAQLAGEGGTVAVTAPIAGVITKAAITSGEIVDGARVVYTIADLSKVWVEADLFEGDLPRVEGAVEAVITTPAVPDATFAGRLYRTGSSVDPASRTITALFLVDNPGERLKLNMSASVALATGGRSRVLAVPQGAIVESGGRRRVFVHTAPEEFQARDVVLGAEEGGYVEIVSGVKVGERVVSSGGYQLGGR
jgi:cobalt-zinc-cadmium efflux system membrane fusion protein